ncbi:hypothetical protein PRNP1_010619 [Phytophthora ramorum]
MAPSGAYEAPTMERHAFTTWDDFFSFMEEYQQRTGQSFSRRSATSVKTRNQVLASIAVSGRPLPSPLLPESFLDYSRTLQCSHKLRGDAAKANARWNGVQPSECQARVNATLQLCDDSSYRIRVTKMYLVHNHPLGANVEQTEAAASGSAETDAAKRRRVGRPRKYPRPDEAPDASAARYTTTEHVPTMADVRSFLERVDLARSHQPRQLQSVEERLASYVNEFAAQDGNAAKIFVDDEKFKAHNARHPRIRALILPHGDSLALEELRASFPAARVLYSQFHVVRALHQAIAEHGKDLTSWHRDRLTGIAQILVYAPTSLVYGANIAAMAEVLGSKQHPFFRYFLEKWDSCRDRWATFAREGVTTFSVSENDDQFTPTWKEIFAAVNDKMALDETVAAIRYYQAVVERAFIRDLNHEANKLSNAAAHNGTGSNKDEYDAEMRLLSATVSPAASSLIFPQYRFAISRGAYQFCEPSRGSFFVSAVAPNDIFCDEPSKEFCVEADRGWQCSCAFMVNHHLPCRHVFYIRRIVRCSCVIPMEHIGPRWVLAKAKYFFGDPLQNVSSTGDVAREAGLEQGSDYERRSGIAPPGSWQKYVTAQEIGKRISQRMMEMEPEEFNRAVNFYKLVETTLNVRPFTLNTAAVARLRGQARVPAPPKPTWVEPDPTRTLAPRAGHPAVAGTRYASAGDHVAAAAARRVLQARLTSRSLTAPAKADVIDLQDESEEEEKRDSGHQNESGEATVSTSEHDNGSEEESSAGKENNSATLHENQPAGESEYEVASKTTPDNNEDDAQDDEEAKGREPWEGIDDLGTNPEDTASTSPPHSQS